MARLRAYLVLGRVSNLSTVWSNVVCAWIISGGSDGVRLACLLVGASLLYVAGMVMNDLRDVAFDRAHRPERPIPSGVISTREARTLAMGLFGLGFLSIAWMGWLAAGVSLVLVGLICVYNLVHKKTAFAPLAMGACRAALYFVVAATIASGVDWVLVWAAGVMFAFVLGITYVARTEATTNRLSFPGLGLVLFPLAFAIFYRMEHFGGQDLAATVALAVWIGLSFSRARTNGRIIVGKTIGPLLAGIPFVDAMLVASFGFASSSSALIFCGFFVSALLAQRYVPAS